MLRPGKAIARLVTTVTGSICKDQVGHGAVVAAAGIGKAGAG
jgi:hypothetical protein